MWVLGVFLLKSCETFSFSLSLSLCMVRALFTNVSLFTFLEDNYGLFCVSLYYTYTKFLLSFSLSLCFVTISIFKSLFLSLCAGFGRYEILYSSLSLFMVGVLQTKFCVCFSHSLPLSTVGNKCVTLALLTAGVSITKFMFLSV